MSFSSRTASSRLTLLIADGDPVVRSALSVALDSYFAIVAVLDNGTQAAAQATDSTPDAALVDADMPAGGGLDAVRGITAGSPGTAIIVVSADEALHTVVQLLQAGAMSYCRKGLDPHRLAETVERSIRAHRELAFERRGRAAA